jgi:CRP-like cAMP-binding protein
MNEFLVILNSIHTISTELRSHLIQTLKTETRPKKSFLLKEGELCKSMFFIEKGLVRCYYEHNSKEVCSWFMKEGDLIVSVESFFQQKASYESIQVLEDCTLIGVQYDELQDMYKRFPEMNFIGRVLTEKYYTLSEQRLYSIRMLRAQERYKYLINNFPELIQRVPSKYLSSYLSVSEETLSRIKSKI